MGRRTFVITILLTTSLLLMFTGRSVLSVTRQLRDAEAIVLLAGNYEERAPSAAAMFLAGKGRSIILANDGVRRGWSREHQRNLYSIERSEKELVRCGVPLQAIIRLPFLKSGTVYDALAVRKYVDKHNIHSILLVTSDYHTSRTLWIFQRVFKQLPVTIGIEPTPSSSSYISSVASEYIKFAYYLIRFGWLGNIPEIVT